MSAQRRERSTVLPPDPFADTGMGYEVDTSEIELETVNGDMNIHEIRRHVVKHDSVLFHPEFGVIPHLKSLKESVCDFHRTMKILMAVIAVTLIYMAAKNG